MEKILIGYKQGDQSYVYVSAITKTNINITTVIEEAMEFTIVDTAKEICGYLNNRHPENGYVVLQLKLNIKEVK